MALWDNFAMEKTASPMQPLPAILPGAQPSLSGLWRHAGVRAAFFFCLYVVLDRLTYVFPARFGVTPFNPEAAIAVVMLMFCGMRYVPLVFIATLWGEYSLPAVQRPWAVMLLNSAVLTAAYAAMAHLLTHRFRVRIDMDTRRDLTRLMGVTLVCMLLCGIAYVGVLISFGIGPADRYFNGARRFFIGYSVGILIAAPLVLMLFSEKRRAQFAACLRAREAWLLVAAIATCIWWVFGQDKQDHVRYFYVLFLPVIWAAARFGTVGAAGSLSLIQSGVFAVMYLTGYQPLSVFELQLLLIALAITGLLLGVAIDEQQRAASDFRESLHLAAAGEMAAAITHEINQPLTALAGYATAGQLLAAAPALDHARLKQTMAKLVEESKRTAAVVRRLRDFFRSGATRLERVMLAELVERVVASQRARAQASNVTLECEIPGGADTLKPVLVDTVQIEVVLRNLLMNALDSAAQAASSGSVRLSVTVNQAGMQQVEVRDSGSGILAQDAERMFESFVTTKTAGMGMGLAISRAIMEAHGGKLWAVPGGNGVLCFTLPQDAPSEIIATQGKHLT
jgi:two-component system, LuxR family, sensor kinase FixL